MSQIMLRISLAIAVLFAVVAVGARSAQSNPEDVTAQAPTPVEKAAPSTPAAHAAAEKITTDLLGNVVVPMSCTITSCTNTCKLQHKCDGYCSPHGGCVCFGTPPCP